MGRKSFGARGGGPSKAGRPRALDRRSERHSLEQPAPVIVHCFQSFQSGRLVNFSESGLCIQGVSGLFEGDCVRLQFVYREAPIVTGLVQWAVADRVGIQLSEQLPRALKRHLYERILPPRIVAGQGAAETRDGS
jgi:PilZ domain